MAFSLVLPGDPIPQEALPTSNPSVPLKLGPGLRHTPPDTVVPIVAGELCIDQKKNAVWVENNGGRLSAGSLVYARISLANKHVDPEIECVNPATGKSDGLGELKGGMLFDVSLGMSRRLMMPNPSAEGSVVILDEIAEKVPFEIAVGRNGRVWVDAEGIAKTLVVGRAIQKTDRGNLGVDEQRKAAKRLLKDI
ncbi:hypothetical protein GP486_001002 [Trichoglossum hirsutum]|uniref:Ribosomal RNA-processing protein 40 n=1 Tax=Trichoglossum hirsutum TaxID=265104 RepID=A0A9P8LI02_9PEZI|nr:hypothetical protein GP486_001002 [Trichoglossum hirsutum]